MEKKLKDINALINNSELKEEYIVLITYAKIFLAFCY